MKKLLLFSTLLALLFVTNVHGEAQKYEHMAENSASNLEKIKFGVHLHSITSGHKVGVFAEYEIHEAFGLQTGLLWFNDVYIMLGLEGNSDKHALVAPKHLSVPLIARFYPGEGRQFCMFAGLQVNYLMRGSLLHLNKDTEEGAVESMLLPFSRKSSEGEHKIKDTSAHKLKISNWGSHFVMGFDYETLGGFQFGLECGWGLSSVAECKKTVFNLTFKPTLGYNLAKLFN
jgi:Outer membrane protein beta-barrel domain